MRDGPRLEAYLDNCRPNWMTTGPMDSKSCLFCQAHATPIRPNTDFSPLLFSKPFRHFQCYPLILSLLLAPVHFVGSGQPSSILYPVLQYSLLSVPHLARRRDLSGPREHLKPFGPTDWLSKVHRILFSTCPQGLTYRPIWPNRQSPVPVYRSGLTGLPVGLTGNRPNSIFFLF